MCKCELVLCGAMGPGRPALRCANERWQRLPNQSCGPKLVLRASAGGPPPPKGRLLCRHGAKVAEFLNKHVGCVPMAYRATPAQRT